MIKNQIDLPGIRTSDDLTILNFGSKQPVIVLAAHTSQMRVGNQHDLGLLAEGE
jgi:hypothetical protein